MQTQISSVKTYCELAERLLFFETSQSCVSTIATLSHRFKSSPAIPGKLAVPDTAGYMMKAGHFSKSHVSSGDLNRLRSPEVRKPLACFLVLFARRKKNKTVLPCRELRGSANLEAVRPNNNFPLTQLNPFAAPRPFRRPWRHYFLLLTQQIFALRAIIGGFAASFPPYGGVPAGTARSACLWVRGLKNLEPAYRSRGFTIRYANGCQKRTARHML